MKTGKRKNKKPKVKINFFYNTPLAYGAKDEKMFKKLLRAGLGKLAFENIEVNVVFVSGREIKSLNKKFLNKNSITDVIAFNYFPPSYILTPGGLCKKSKISPFIGESKYLLSPCGRGYEVRGMRSKYIIEPFGDIFICIPQAKRQAETLNHSLKKELAVLITHGVLHLVGFDDKTSTQQKKMHKEGDRIIAMMTP